MKVLIQKLPIENNASFVARTYTTPNFETAWHQHVEIELMTIKQSQGTAFVGNFIGEYHENEVYLLGQNLPHWFRKSTDFSVGSSSVIHFNKAFLGLDFFSIPELKSIKKLLEIATHGLLLKDELAVSIHYKIIELEHKTGLDQLLSLLQILGEISKSDSYVLLDTNVGQMNVLNQPVLHKIFEFSMQNFKRKIELSEVAELNNQSISAFSHFFKKSTKKSYIQFLTQIRISHACHLLENTSMSVTDICYESGFNNWANFSAHFKKVTGNSPLKYKKSAQKKTST